MYIYQAHQRQTVSQQKCAALFAKYPTNLISDPKQKPPGCSSKLICHMCPEVADLVSHVSYGT